MGYYQGDPFFGAALPILGKLAPKLIPGLGRVAGKIGAAIGKRGGPILRKGAPIVAGGAAFEAGRRLLPDGERKKYRRMNVTNVRALRRAIRRTKGFAKLARSVITFTSPRAPKGKMTFKSGKRR